MVYPIVTLSDVSPRAWVTTLRSKFLGSKYAVEINRDEFTKRIIRKDYPEGSYKIKLLRRIYFDVLSNAYKVIVRSNHLKKLAMEWGAKENSIIVRYKQAENIPKIGREKSRIKHRLTGKILLSAGDLFPWNGFNKLIQIMPDLAKRFSLLSMIIIGHGDKYEEIKAEISKLKLKSKLKLVTTEDKATVQEYIEASDIFILNSNDEGLSPELLLAMSCGLPIITTETGGNTEIIFHEKQAVLVEPNNRREIAKAVERILLHEDFAKSLGEEARRTIRPKNVLG